MNTVVLKFGGASVQSPHNFASLADIILDRKKVFSKVVVVVSAMGDTTNTLIELAHTVNSSPPQRELDMLISVGERVSISLLAMALAAKGVEAVSFTGSQSGIITSADHSQARILDIRPHRLSPHLEAGRVVIVAGFQGVSQEKEITTLGRGGSDTTAVALAAALHAERVEFFKDVPGMFDRDPKKSSTAQLLPTLNYDEALAVVEGGAEILHSRCLHLAKVNNIPLSLYSFHAPEQPGTRIMRSSEPCKASPIFENAQIKEMSIGSF